MEHFQVIYCHLRLGVYKCVCTCGFCELICVIHSGVCRIHTHQHLSVPPASNHMHKTKTKELGLPGEELTGFSLMLGTWVLHSTSGCSCMLVAISFITSQLQESLFGQKPPFYSLIFVYSGLLLAFLLKSYAKSCGLA